MHNQIASFFCLHKKTYPKLTSTYPQLTLNLPSTYPQLTQNLPNTYLKLTNTYGKLAKLTTSLLPAWVTFILKKNKNFKKISKKNPKNQKKMVNFE